MSSADHTGRDDGDAADTASFQQFVDDRERRGPAYDDHVPSDDGRTFRLLSLLAGIVVLVAVMYLLLF